MTGLLSPVHLALLALVLLLVFGGRRLPQIGRILGTGIRARLLGRPPAGPPAAVPARTGADPRDDPRVVPSAPRTPTSPVPTHTGWRLLRLALQLAPGRIGWIARLFGR